MPCFGGVWPTPCTDLWHPGGTRDHLNGKITMALGCGLWWLHDIPPKYGLIWYSTSILGSWNSHWMTEFTSDFAFFHPKKSEKSVCGKRRRHYAGLAQGPCQAFGREAQLQFQGKFQSLPNGGFLSHGGTPSHHPFFVGNFLYKPSTWWVPFQETSKWFPPKNHRDCPPDCFNVSNFSPS